MSYYPTQPGTYIPQQPVNPYGGMNSVGFANSVPPAQMPQPRPQAQPMTQPQPAQQPQDNGFLLGRPVSSREEFLAIPSDLYGRPTYCPDLRSGVIYCKRLNPDTCESTIETFYSPAAWQQLQAQQTPATPPPQYVPLEQYKALVQQVNELEAWRKSFSKSASTAKKGDEKA